MLTAVTFDFWGTLAQDWVDDVAGARGAGMLAVHYTGGDRPGSDQAHVAVGDLTELADRLFRVAP